jgi:hypothetical protein
LQVKHLLSKPKKQEEASHVMNVSLPLQTTAPSTSSQCVQCVQSSPDPSAAPRDSSAATINPPTHGIHEALGHRHRERASRSPRLVKRHRHSSPPFSQGRLVVWPDAISGTDNRFSGTLATVALSNSRMRSTCQKADFAARQVVWGRDRQRTQVASRRPMIIPSTLLPWSPV